MQQIMRSRVALILSCVLLLASFSCYWQAIYITALAKATISASENPLGCIEQQAEALEQIHTVQSGIVWSGVLFIGSWLALLAREATPRAAGGRGDSTAR